MSIIVTARDCAETGTAGAARPGATRASHAAFIASRYGIPAGLFLFIEWILTPQVPLDGAANARIESLCRPPSKFIFHSRAVDRVPEVVSEAIGDACHQLGVLAGRAGSQLVEDPAYLRGDVDVA